MKLSHRALSLICAVLIIWLTLPLPTSAAQQSAPSLSAKSAILIDASDRSVLYEKNGRERMGMASTTKIMTALVICELLPLDKTVSIPAEAVNTEGSSVYLVAGELLSVRELLYALLLASANDAAVALAIAASGSVEDFATEMNKKARELGLSDSNFVNPHGLYDESHYTTAYDLAIIASEAMREPTLREIASTKKATIPQGITPDNTEGEAQRYLYNHNKMLHLYEGAIGVKTGFTKKTGRCLVSAAERDGLTLIAVTLNASDDWHDHSAMLDYGYSLYERVTLFDIGEFTCPYAISGGNEGYVTLSNASPIILTLPKERQRAECSVLSNQHFEFAPIEQGEILATLRVTASKKNASSPLIATHAVEAKTKNKKEHIWTP